MPRRGVLPSRGHRLEARGSQRGGRREANFGARLACGGMTKEWGNASSRLALAIMAGALSGCVVGPNYQRPSAPMATAYKEAIGWSPAHPSDAADRQDWWTVFNDPVLNDLEQQVQVSNQNLKAAEAAFRQAEALVSEQRAALFPTLSVTGSASKAGGGGAGMVGSSPYEIGAEASWAPDVWGGVRRAVEAAKDSAQASDADLANARLSAQTSLALDYILLRQLDEEKRLQDATVAAYQRTLMVTQNRYDAGAVSVSDVLAARTQLASSQGDDTDLAQQRAKFEHAVALLAGRPPSTLTLAPIAWVMPTPDIPPEIPSGLLQRRPDIAAAERRAAASNAQIGVAVAAYFPTLTLVGQGGGASSQLGRLFSASTSFWSIGAAAAETVFDAGARSAKVKQNRAAYAQAVANYRQTVLTAFGQVEDALAAQRVLGVEQTPRDAAVAAATRNERVSLNQYQAGQVDYTAVVVAQVAALSAWNTALQNQASRLANAVTLINALGGGWTTDGRPRGSVAAAAPVQSLESE